MQGFRGIISLLYFICSLEQYWFANVKAMYASDPQRLLAIHVMIWVEAFES